MSGKRVSASHIHSFALNYAPRENHMRGTTLPQADNLPDEIQSFESLRDFAGRAFNVLNIDVVSTPPWAYNLFQDG